MDFWNKKLIYPFNPSREGTKCNQCIALPGCEHGTCEDAFECNCENGWTGAYCDIGTQSLLNKIFDFLTITTV